MIKCEAYGRFLDIGIALRGLGVRMAMWLSYPLALEWRSPSPSLIPAVANIQRTGQVWGDSVGRFYRMDTNLG